MKRLKSRNKKVKIRGNEIAEPEQEVEGRRGLV
jgi:hypothetical protein